MINLALFKKKEKRIITVDGKQIELQPKPSKGIFSSFKTKLPKPVAKPPAYTAQAAPAKVPISPAVKEERKAATGNPPHRGPSALWSLLKRPAKTQTQEQQPAAKPKAPDSMERQQQPGTMQPATPSNQQPAQKTNPWQRYVHNTAIKNRRVEDALKEHGVRGSLYDFIQRMLIASIIISAVIAITFILVFLRAGLPLALAIVLAAAIGFMIHQFSFRSFMNFPLRKAIKASKNVERDILFAARDMIISLRSGMPLYNAIVSVSTGYGDASAEFAKITERVQLGMPLEEAIDQTTAETRSQSFRKIMLQASVSIKAGADVVSALQSMIDELEQERIISLRKYGQRLNAIAMFYMLFGIILPSMGIAVATILTTFISIFQINTAILEAALVGLIFMQLVFLQLIRGSRPSFAM